MNRAKNRIEGRRTGGCLYCGSSGPYSDEHVVPAGMGGDDPHWLLTECVCHECNTVIFSPLESDLLRRSPVALGRFFNQKGTRDRKKPPTFETRTTLVHDPESNLLFAATPGEHGEFRFLPQLVCFKDSEGATVAGTATTQEEFSEFLKAVGLVVQNEICLIVKQGRRSFQLFQLQWENSHYVPRLPETASKPPSDGIWLEPLDRPTTAEQGAVLPRCLYQRPQNHLACRARNVEEACKVLHLARLYLQRVQDGMDVPKSKFEVLAVHVGMLTDIKKADRALVKVGLNFLAFCVSKEVMRNEAFDDAVRLVLEGSESVGSKQVNGNTLGPALPNRHVLVLLQERDGSVCFFSRLYGGAAQVFQLGRLDFFPPALSEPLILHVDYNSHQIRRCSLEEHAVSIADQFAEPLANDGAF